MQKEKRAGAVRLTKLVPKQAGCTTLGTARPNRGIKGRGIAQPLPFASGKRATGGPRVNLSKAAKRTTARHCCVEALCYRNTPSMAWGFELPRVLL
jgi:hypothetical protein